MKTIDFKSVCFGQTHKDFNSADIELIRKIKRLANQHTKQCVNSCNGCGMVNGQMYYTGLSFGQQPDKYIQTTYGYNVRSAYSNSHDDNTVFDKAIYVIQAKIKSLLGISHVAKKQEVKGMSCLEKGYIAGKYTLGFQQDPRGKTVILYYENYLMI